VRLTPWGEARSTRPVTGPIHRYVTRGTRTATRAAGTVLAAGLAFGVLAGLAPATASAAPGDHAIAQARAQADALEERIGILSGRLERAQAQVDAARAQAAIALDDFQATQEELQAAEQRSVEAEAAAEKALADLGVARGEVVDFARQSYMDGSTSPGAAALLTAGSPAELIERSALLEAAGAHRSNVLDRVTVLQDRAAKAQVRAEVAVDEAKTLKRRAASQLAVASNAEAAARQKSASVAARSTALKDELKQAEYRLAGLVGAQEAVERARRLREAAEPKPEPVVSPPPSSSPAPVKESTAGSGSASAAQTAIAAAKQYLGTSYAWGGGGTYGPGWGWGIDDGVWGFDCSGLTQYAYAQAGISIPRNSRAQYAELPKVSASDLRPGDLVFWATSPSNPATIHHVAIYLGGGQIIEAPQSGDVVKISSMRWYHYAGAVRPTA
jgi:peptidoglycan DL-endopeptidase RipA